MALKILHYVPEVSEGSTMSKYTDTLLRSMSQRADVGLCVLSVEPSVSPTSYPVFTLQDNERRPFYRKGSQLLDLQRRYLQHLYDTKPDIVHIHGSWNFWSSRIALWSRKRGFLVVLSPCDTLEVVEDHTDYGMKMWKMICYQKQMLRHASAIHVTDPLSFQGITGGNLNSRCEYFEGFVPDDESSYESLSDDMLRLYRKLLDSHATDRMDTNSHEALSSLLHVGLESDMQQSLSPESILNLRRLTPSSWRYISLVAHDHGVSEYIRRGTVRMQLRLADTDAAGTDRFAPSIMRDTDPLPRDVLLSGNRKTRKQLNQLFDRDSSHERQLAVMLLNLRYHYDKRDMSLRHLCDIYDSLMIDDIDEDLLCYGLEHLHLYDFARRVCQLLSECAYLPEGFMPVYKLDDKETERMRQFIVTY